MNESYNEAYVEQENVSDCECCPLFRFVVYSPDNSSQVFFLRDEAEEFCEQVNMKLLAQWQNAKANEIIDRILSERK
jgi:hypothetical protein